MLPVVAGGLGALAAIQSSCNPSTVNSGDGGTDDSGTFNGPYSDFPKDAIGAGGIMDIKARSLSTQFGSAMNNATGGPCLSEPTVGALYPRNFTPPLFEWSAPAGQNIYELRLHVDNQLNDLLLYTDKTSYTMSDAMWSQLANDSRDHDVQITVRSAALDGAQNLLGAVSTGTSGSVHIAPVTALGTIVYWTTSGGSAFKGFRIGDKQVQTVITPATVGGGTQCVGCHASSPDGLQAFFTRSPNPGGGPFSIDARLVDGTSAQPGSITANALSKLSRANQDLPTLSKTHYGPGDSIAITVLNHADTANKWEIVWTDLLAQTGGSGTVARTGDVNSPATPAFSHDGQTIAYSSSDCVIDGRLCNGNGELWTVPYGNRNGGTAKALPGVNTDTQYNQYYPVYSPNDTFLAFNRNKRGNDMYNAPTAEVFIAPAAGGTPVRIAGNDPPACTGMMSPGLTNSWPRWSPSSTASNGKHYYWLVFSSRRRPGALPQLFLSAIVTKDSPGGEVVDATYPAIYISTQIPTESNHTPAWDEFMIPIG